ncbi:AraC family transcriptional regulator, partial [Aeromonas rivipollensis]
MLYLPADRLEAISGERGWYFAEAVRSDPRTAPVLQAALDALWHCDSELAADGLLLGVCEILRPHARAL